MVRANLNAGVQQRRRLIAELAEKSGNPRDACLRFVRQLGVTTRRHYRKWPERDRVRRCGGANCDWLFMHNSRNHSRRWCDMGSCGNRAKARRYYARHKEDA